jgi:hypothetical protein
MSLTMCKIEGCPDKPIAKGLCAKHYMRERRTGDAKQTRKPGRKPDAYVALLRGIVGEDFGSPSTFARYTAAMKMLRVVDIKTRQAAVTAASRPNGTLNVSKLLGIASMHYVGSLPDDEGESS